VSSFPFQADRANTGHAGVAELAATLSLFVGGSKSTKLALAFETFDARQEGWLDKRTLWCFLRCFLSAIAGMCHNNDDHRLNSVMAEGTFTGLPMPAIDNACGALVDRIFQDLPHLPLDQPLDQLDQLDQPPDTVTFEAFAEWYTSIGHEFAPWLELLVSVDIARPMFLLNHSSFEPLLLLTMIVVDHDSF
jgi:hypothetical protein